MSEQQQDRLESWKEIGAYLQRDARTVRRWEKEEGLPVHRHGHKSGRSVYAFPSEIDAWRALRRVVPEPPAARPLWKIPAFALTMLLCLVMVGNGTRPVIAQSSGISNRLICTGSCADEEADISPDGRWMAQTDWATGDLQVRDLLSGKTTRMMARTGSYVDKASPDGTSYVEAPVFSPDLRSIAYTFVGGEHDEIIQLRVMPNEVGGKPRILVNNPENDYLDPVAWSPDGTKILLSIKKLDETWQLAWVSVKDGALVPLKSLGWRFQFKTNHHLGLTRDGRYIAYSAFAVNPKKPKGPFESKDVHIYVIAADGSSEFEIVKTTGLNNNPVWTADGKHILFTSDRSGSLGLWSIPVREGQPAGPASLVRADVGDVDAMGMHGGSFYYRQRIPNVDSVSIVAMPNGSAKPMVLDSFVGMNPLWSPDGKSISIKRHRPGSANAYDLVVHSLETGDEKTYSTNLGPMANGQARYFHDGQSITTGVLVAGVPSFYRVDLKTGEFRPLPPVGSLSPDDKTGYSMRSDPQNATKPRWLVATDLASGEERTILTLPRPGSAIANLSPDGRKLAVLWQQSGGGNLHVLRLGVDGTGYREVYSTTGADGGGIAGPIVWTADGRSILYVRRHTDKLQLMRLPEDGGEPLATGIEDSAPGALFFDVSPDGSRLAYSSLKNLFELWVLDNVPPTLK